MSYDQMRRNTEKQFDEIERRYRKQDIKLTFYYVLFSAILFIGVAIAIASILIAANILR